MVKVSLAAQVAHLAAHLSKPARLRVAILLPHERGAFAALVPRRACGDASPRREPPPLADARRPDGSMHPAVDGMMIEYRLAFYSFFSGLVSFHLSAALFGWMMFYPDHWMGDRPSPRPRP